MVLRVVEMQPPKKENLVNLGAVTDFYQSQAVISALTTQFRASSCQCMTNNS